MNCNRCNNCGCNSNWNNNWNNGCGCNPPCQNPFTNCCSCRVCRTALNVGNLDNLG